MPIIRCHDYVVMMNIHSIISSNHFQRLLLPALITGLVSVMNNIEASAQVTHERPKIGLVLSGGGAHGIAHLGVLKVMEEAGLRPDYITGVSMGSIVGGMYSMGYSADSLQKIFRNLNWKFILSNKLPENKVIFLEKNHFSNSAVSLPLSFRKVILPSGLINGQQVENTLNFYAWPAADIDDFTKLPVPFLCVATDIITYTKIVLKTGYLPDAIRASFSVPSIFTPIKIDTLLLLDGGLIRNFAASEAKEMGADIIIGSYVGFSRYKADRLQTVSGIIEQIAMFRSLDDFEKEKKIADVLIMPDIKGLSILGFDNSDSLIQRGYIAALPFKTYFKKLADSLNLIAIQKPLKNILDKKYYSFSKIEIAGNKNYSDDQILGVLNIIPGQKVDKFMLTDRIELLYGKAWFEKVKYRMISRNDSLILLIDCVEKPQSMLYGAIHYDNTLQSGLIFELSTKNALTQRSIINLRSRIGQYYRFDLSYLQFVDRNQVYGLSADLRSDNTLIPLFDIRGDKGDVISRNFISELSVNRRIGLNNIMSISETYENTNLILHYISDISLKNLSFNYLTATFCYQINSLDSKHFPDNGTKSEFTTSSSRLKSASIKTDSSKSVLRQGKYNSFPSDRFYTIHWTFDHFYSPSNKVTFLFGGDFLYTTGTDTLSSQNNFHLLGGFESVGKRTIPMVGFQPNEVAITKTAGLRTSFDIEPYENFHLNVMASVFAIRESYRKEGFSILGGIGIGAGYMSIIGPLKIGLMYGIYKREEYFKRLKGYISIGYNF